MSNDKLFNEFPPVSTEEWENLINIDLKGADYEKKLIWRTDEGFKVRPYYREEDLKNISYLNTLPDEFPYTRGDKATGNHWNIVQEISEAVPSEANKIATDSLAKGASMVSFNASNINTLSDLEILLNGINLEQSGVLFQHASDYVKLTTFFVQYITNKGFKKELIHGGVDFDPVTYYLKQTRFYHSQEEDLAQMLELISLTKEMPNFKVVNVNGLAIHNAGATIVQEMGYALGIANEYFAFGTSKGLSADQIGEKIQLTLSIGSNYFLEIAKLRSIRQLWATMVNEYKPQHDKATTIHIHSVASMWNKTIYDPYVNMLRTTTEGMSAAIGGADSISLKPFDAAYKKDDTFSRRISRNVQSMLKEESFFDKVVDPAAGSYYIENLTDSLSQYAWELFRHIEAEGGMIKLIASGEVKTEIEKSCQKRNMDIATRKYILLGTNQYPNTNEMMADKIEKKCNCDSPGLKTYRGAMAFEELRLATEEYAKKNGRPKVFLLKLGNVNMRQARAGFATNFFGCAGYEILDNTGFATVEEGMKAAKEAKANLIVICSSDEEYATLGVEAAQQAKVANVPFVVAGNPTESIEALKAAGTLEFIHVKTNVLESLKAFNQLILK